jgi:hypothetical protein
MMVKGDMRHENVPRCHIRRASARGGVLAKESEEEPRGSDWRALRLSAEHSIRSPSSSQARAQLHLNVRRVTLCLRIVGAGH